MAPMSFLVRNLVLPLTKFTNVVLWFVCKRSPIGFHVYVLGRQMMVLFIQVVEPLGDIA